MSTIPNTIDPTGNRSFSAQAIETTLLVELLSKKTEGTTVTYAEMEAVAGRPVTPGAIGYRYLRSAKRILIRDYAIVADAEPNIGVRICTNEEKMLVAGRDTKRARRAVHASRQKLRSVEYEQLDDGKKREWNARMSIVGALDLLSAPKALGKAVKAVETAPLPSAQTLKLFGT